MSFFIDILRTLCYLLSILIIVRAVLSWFVPWPRNVVVYYIYRITDTILAPLRRVIPRMSPVDFTPMVAILLLYLISYALGFLYRWV